jgi:hypothetical protein
MAWRAIAIKEEIYNKPLDTSEEALKSRGIKVELYLPPTDVPQYICSEYDKERDLFCIVFKYTNSEREKELFNQENSRFLIGSQSGKPLRIELSDIVKRGIDQVKLVNIIKEDISRLIESNICQSQHLRERTNLQCAGQVLKVSASELALQPA